MERVLLHCCCAPCSLSCIEPLRAEGIEPVAFWHNPNIHPWKEYEARRNCLLEYAPTIGMEAIVQERIDNLAGAGTVRVDGKIWSARSAGGEYIPSGATVRVERIEGVKLIVSPLCAAVTAGEF